MITTALSLRSYATRRFDADSYAPEVTDPFAILFKIASTRGSQRRPSEPPPVARSLHRWHAELVREVADRLWTRREFAGAAAALLLPSGTRAAALRLVLHVPGRYPSIASALAAIAASPPPPGTRVEIRVADGLYRLTETIRLNLDIGKDVHLLGNAAEPRRCVLEWTAPKVDGLVVSDGHMFGLVDGFTVRKPVKAEWPDNYTGILALRNSRLRVGPHVVVENWYYGAAARVASTLWCDGVQVRNAGDVGIWSYRRSTVFAHGASSTGARDVVNGWGFGFQAEYGSTLHARGAHADRCLKAGFAALSGSHARLPVCVAERNDGSGFLVRESGTIVADGATARLNRRYGVEIDGVGAISGLLLNRDNGLGQVGHGIAPAASVPAREVAY